MEKEMGEIMMIDEKYQEELVNIRRHLHAFPELSLEEAQTSKYIYHYLTNLGLQVNKVGDYGLISTIYAPSQPAKTVAIRLEMDGVAVKEENEVAWKSQNEGVMHACGHDAIMACGMVLARLCSENREKLPVNVKFIFQQAEENGKGTQMMLDGGVMENPKVDDFILFHFVNDATSGIELHKGASSAAIGAVHIKITGKSTHWATQELGINAMEVATEVLYAIQTINQNYVSNSPFVLGVGLVQGGTARNVVAGEVEMQGTLRACRIKDYMNLKQELMLALEKIKRNTKALIEYEITPDPVPPIMNDDALVDLGLEVGQNIWNNHCQLTSTEYLSGDSAAYYLENCRGIYCIFTAKKENEEAYSLHNGKFDIDENVMGKALMFLYQFIDQLG